MHRLFPVDAQYKSALGTLNKAVAGSSIEDFLQAVENALEACGMILKKVDKKKDRYGFQSKSIQKLGRAKLSIMKRKLFNLCSSFHFFL